MLRETPGGIVLPLPSPLLGMLPPRLQELPMKVFWAAWAFFALTVSAGANPAATLAWQNSPNYWFAAWFGIISLRSGDRQTDRSASPLTASLTDNALTSYQTQQQPVDVRNWFSTAGISQPAVWPAPLLVRPNGTLNLTLTNQDTANDISAQPVAVGVLIGPTTITEL